MKQAVLLLNMGGPNNIDEVELFLRNMFSDPNILPVNPLLRRFIGSRIIRSRLDEAKENYMQLGGKSPLSKITASLAKKVEKLSGLPVRPAMRYVPPFADKALEEFRDKGIERIIAFPMYPQYSTTTTLSSVEDLKAKAISMGYEFDLSVIDPYGQDADYVDIVASSIIDSASDVDLGEYDLIFSAHGLPMSIIKAGDPYKDQVEAEVAAVSDELRARGIEFRNIRLAYQSKVGRSAWLEPSLTDLLRNPSNTRVVVYPISFTVDNSETLFELDIEHREIAEKIGYEDYRVVGCPNDHDKFAAFIAKRINEAI